MSFKQKQSLLFEAIFSSPASGWTIPAWGFPKPNWSILWVKLYSFSSMKPDKWAWPLSKGTDFPAVIWKLPSTLFSDIVPWILQASYGSFGSVLLFGSSPNKDDCPEFHKRSCKLWYSSRKYSLNVLIESKCFLCSLSSSNHVGSSFNRPNENVFWYVESKMSAPIAEK